MYRFIDSSWNFPDVSILPLKLPPPVGWGLIFFIFFSGQFLTFPGLFEPLKFPLGWVTLFWVRTNPGSIRICVPNLVAVRRSCRKVGGGIDRQTDIQTDRQTYIHTYTQMDAAALYSRWHLQYKSFSLGDHH